MTPATHVPIPPEALPSAGARPPVVFVAPVWEYKHLIQPQATGGALDETALNQLGREGWELVGVVAQGDQVHFYFKREAVAGR
jgi:hypothetical protein